MDGPLAAGHLRPQLALPGARAAAILVNSTANSSLLVSSNAANALLCTNLSCPTCHVRAPAYLACWYTVEAGFCPPGLHLIACDCLVTVMPCCAQCTLRFAVPEGNQTVLEAREKEHRFITPTGAGLSAPPPANPDVMFRHSSGTWTSAPGHCLQPAVIRYEYLECGKACGACAGWALHEVSVNEGKADCVVRPLPDS